MRDYIAKHNPTWKLVFECPPPRGVRLLCRGLHTPAIISHYDPEFQFVAWMELPKYDKDTRRRLDAIVESGMDPTTFQGR
jgi:hypothetical protein